MVLYFSQVSCTARERANQWVIVEESKGKVGIIDTWHLSVTLSGVGSTASRATVQPIIHLQSCHVLARQTDKWKGRLIRLNYHPLCDCEIIDYMFTIYLLQNTVLPLVCYLVKTVTFFKYISKVLVFFLNVHLGSSSIGKLLLPRIKAMKSILA